MKAALTAALVLLVIGGSAAIFFSRDIEAAKARVTDRSHLIQTSFGTLELPSAARAHRF